MVLQSAAEEARKLFNQLTNPQPQAPQKTVGNFIASAISRDPNVQLAKNMFGVWNNNFPKVVAAAKPTLTDIANQTIHRYNDINTTLKPFGADILKAFNPGGNIKAISNYVGAQPLLQAPGVGPRLNLPKPTLGDVYGAFVEPGTPLDTLAKGNLTGIPQSFVNMNKKYGDDQKRFFDTMRKQSRGLPVSEEDKKFANEYNTQMIMGMLGPTESAGVKVRKGLEPAVEFLRGKLNKEDILLLDEFSDIIGKAGGQANRKNLGEIGSQIQTFLEAAFGKKAVNWSNTEARDSIQYTLKRLMSGKNAFSMGLATKDVSEGFAKGEGSFIRQGARTGDYSNVLENEHPFLNPEQQKRVQERISSGKAFVDEMLQESKRVKDPRNIAQPIERIVDESFNDVKKKVNILDNLRTPNRVYEKIGLGNEVKLLRQKYDDYLTDLPKEIDKITEWSKQVDQTGNERIFNYLDGKLPRLDNPAELKVATEIKGYLKTWADKLGLPQDKRITSYITHIFPKGAIEKEFDPEVAKLIRGKVVKSVYDPFLQHRVGMPEYKTDTFQALDAYTKRAVRKFHMDQALEQVAAKAENLPEESYNYVKSHIARINMQPTQLDNLMDNLVKSSPIGYKLGQRPTTSVTQTARQAVFRGLLGLNPGSALRNIQQSTNTYSQLGEKNFGIGLMKTLQNMPKYLTNKNTELEDVAVLGKDIIQDRTINATHKFWENLDKGLFYMFNQAEKFNRSVAYFGGKAKALSEGKTDEEAVRFAKDLVGKTQFNYDVIDTPAALQSDLSKTVFQFAKYPVAQAEFLTEMVKNKKYAQSLRWLASNLLFIGTAGKVLGLEPKDMLPQFRFGVPPTLQAPLEIGKAAINAPDKYGKTSDETNPIYRITDSPDVQKSIMNYVPAGGQIKKTGGNILDTMKGGSYTPSGNKRFDVNPSLQGAMFGSYSTPEGQSYLDKLFGRNLSPEENQAKVFSKAFTKQKNVEDMQVQQMYDQLKKTSSPDQKRALLNKWNQEGVLSDKTLDQFDNLVKDEAAQNDGVWAKALRKSSTSNEGRAKFILSSLKGKTPDQKRKIFLQLEQANLLTNGLLDAIDNELVGSTPALGK